MSEEKDNTLGEFVFNEIVWGEQRNSESAKMFLGLLEDIKNNHGTVKYTRDDIGEFLFEDAEAEYGGVKTKDRRPFEREMWAAVFNNDVDGYIASILAGANYSYRNKYGYTVGKVAERLGFTKIAAYFNDPIDLGGGSRDGNTPKEILEKAKKIRKEIHEWITSNFTPEQAEELF